MITTLLHLFQSHKYNSKAFLKACFCNPKIIFHSAQRQSLDWTIKIIVLLTGSIWIMLILSIVLYNTGHTTWYELLIGILIILMFFPFYLVTTNFLFFPIQITYEQYIIQKAKSKLKKHKELKVIGIVGSYGKTSQKEILQDVLSTKYEVLATVDNKNTLLSVAYRIIRCLQEKHQIFIVEMWEDHIGDIERLCKLVNPHIGIITWITKQHLDTFWSFNKVISTIWELFEHTAVECPIYMHKNHQELNHFIMKNRNRTIILPQIETYSYLPEFQWISFKYTSDTYTTKLITPHSIYPLITAQEIGTSLSIDRQTIINRVGTITPIQHRMQPIHNIQSDIRVIDDTYNGNIEWFKSGREFMKQLHISWHKRYITPWLIGLGAESNEIHFQLWKALSWSVDKIILIKNANTLSFARGLTEWWTDEKDIIFFISSLEAHQSLGALLVSGDVILFQNDVPDLLLWS